MVPDLLVKSLSSLLKVMESSTLSLPLITQPQMVWLNVAVQTVKSGISKLDGSIESRLSRFLLTYRITPHTSTGISPSELLMGRRIRTCLDLCRPDTTQKVIQKQEKWSNRFHCRNFKIGDKNFTGSQKWIPVEVIKVNGHLSYVLKTNNGVHIRRHVDHLRFR